MVDINKTNTKKYLSWLSTEVTSEKYEQFCSAYEEIEKYCLDKKKIKNELLEIDNIDTVRKVKDIVEKDSIFAFSHKDNKPVLIKAILMFYRYVKENYDNSFDASEERKDFNIDFTDRDNLVFEYMKNIKKAQTVDELKEKLNLDEEKIKNDLKKEESIVLLDEKTQKYIYAPAFPILPEEVEEITDFLDKYLEKKLFIIDLKLTEYIKKKMDRLAIIIKDYTRYGWRDCLGYMIKDKFSIKNAIISKVDNKITSLDCYSKLCREKKLTNISSLRKLSRDLSLPLPFGTILKECIRVNNETLLRRDIVDIDISAVDNCLEKICLNDYFPINDIENYDEFPNIGIEWNGFVLESFLQSYSERFKLINLNFSVETYLGAMVKRNSDISTYDDLIYCVLKDNKDKWSDKESAMKYIVEHKYRLDTNFANLDDIIAKVEKDSSEELKVNIEENAMGLDYGKKPEVMIIQNMDLGEKDSEEKKSEENDIEDDKSVKIKYVYFNETHAGFPNASMMYVDFVNTLLEDYEHIIKDLKNKSIVNLLYSEERDSVYQPKKLANGLYIDNYVWIMAKRDIVDRREISSLSIPGILSNGMCIESDLDLNQILKRIRVLLDVCKIDRNKVQIYVDGRDVLNNAILRSNSNVESIRVLKDSDTEEIEKLVSPELKDNEEIEKEEVTEEVSLEKEEESLDEESLDEEEASEEPITEPKVEEEFYQWLKEKYNMSQLEFQNDVARGIKKIDDFAEEHGIYSGSLYSHLECDEVLQIISKIKSELKQYDEEKMKTLEFAKYLQVIDVRKLVFGSIVFRVFPLNKYLLFLRDFNVEKSNEEDINSQSGNNTDVIKNEESIIDEKQKAAAEFEADIEEKFYQWLRETKKMNRVFFERYVNSYIKKIDSFNKKYNVYDGNLYSNTDCEKVREIKQNLMEHDKFYEENNHILPITRYINFLQQLENHSDVEESEETNIDVETDVSENISTNEGNASEADLDNEEKKDNDDLDNKVVSFLKGLDEKNKEEIEKSSDLGFGVEEKFYQWLHETRGTNRGTFERYINYFIKKIDEFANRNNIYTGSIYSYSNSDEVIEIRDGLMKNREFIRENIQPLPLGRYIKFLEAQESNTEEPLKSEVEEKETKEQKVESKKEETPSENNNNKNNYRLEVEERFYQWLKITSGMSRGTFIRYINYFITKMDEFANKNNFYIGNLYDYVDYDEVKKMKTTMVSSPKFAEVNIPSAPLQKYISFLKENSEQLKELCNKMEIKKDDIAEKEHSLDNNYEKVKTEFYNWLKDTRNLSESSSKTYTTYGITCIDRISNENNVYDKSLYDYTNVQKVNDIKDRLMSTEQFIEENNVSHHTFTATINNYISFVEDVYRKENTAEERYENVEQKEKTEKIKCAETDSIGEKVDFNSDEKYIYTKPVGYVLYDEPYFDLTSWARLYTHFVNGLIETHKDVIEGLKNGKICESDNCLDVASFWNKAALRRPRQLKNSFYLETNLSAKDIVKRIKGLLELCNIDTDEMSIYYQKASSEPIKPSVQPNIPQVETVEKKTNNISDNQINRNNNKFYNILAKYFEKGIRDNSFIDAKKFKRSWQEEYGSELDLSKEELYEELYKITSCYSSKLFIVDEMLGQEAKAELFAKLDEEFESGKKAIYYNVMYRRNMELFFGSMINNEDMLKFYLSNLNGIEYYADRFYLAKEKGIKLDPLEEIKDYLISKGIPQKTEDICKNLSHIPATRIKSLLATNKQFINNGLKEYFHVDIVEFTQEEEDIIKNVIQEEIEQHEFTTEKSLMKLLKQKVPSIFEKYEYISISGLRLVIGYKFNNLFSFSGKIISARYRQLSTNDIYDIYSKTRDVLSMEELKLLRDELDISLIPLDIIYKNVLRINQEKFVSKDNIEFDVEEIDRVIDNFCTGDYISLKDIVAFGAFPDVGFSWNNFLLEHYVAEYSQKYRLIHTDFNTNTCIGAIVKRSSEISDLHSLIVDIIAKSKIALEENVALNYLCDWGLLGRRTYKNINQALMEAKVEREM